MPNLNVLIVYENIPKSTDLFLVPMTEEEFDIVSVLHNHYVNMEGYAQLHSQFEFLIDKTQNFTYTEGKPNTPSWGKYKLDSSQKKGIPVTGVDAIILTGFIL